MRLPFLKPRGAPTTPMDETEWSLFRWTMAVYLASLGLTLAIVIGLAIWGVVHDLNQVREAFLSSQIQRLRSHAHRSVNTVLLSMQNSKDTNLAQIRDNQSLRRHWKKAVLDDESWLYAAVVDPTGKIAMHSDVEFEGKELGTLWYERVVPEGGEDVVFTRDRGLSGGEPALDVRVPIYHEGRLIGTLHNGLLYSWLENELATRRTATLRYWAWILAIIAAALLIAGFSLLQISRRLASLRGRIQLARARRFAEIGQLMAGLVHEIRNPLNAIRLNLHVLAQTCQQDKGSAELDVGTAVEMRQIIQETDQEIARVEELMRVLLTYVRPDRPQTENLDVRQELQSTLKFLQPIFERGDVSVRATFPEIPALVDIDRDRLRQILINLVNNAKEATGPGGQIQIAVERNKGCIEISVSDDGPGVPLADRERVFEPFYSTKETGTGLGLALVRRYVEEVGGTVTCEANEPRGARFRLRFTEISGVNPVPAGT